MKSTKEFIGSVLLNEGIKYVEKNPLENVAKLLKWAGRIAILPEHKEMIKTIEEVVHDPTNNWYQLYKRFSLELDANIRKKVLTNFFINASLVGLPTIEERRQQEGCNIPWAILMDPTAACNLKCKGCWAAEYNKIANLSYETIDRIVSEGKELGMYMYLFSGGEPFLRIDDIVKLARKHNDCIFLPFTNGTLIDEAVAEQLVTVGNIVPAISIEGFEVETDLRRGKNTFKKAIHAMDILHKYGVVFGFSTCYHSQNAQVVGSDDYVDFLIDKGCYFGWYFTYMPLGENADLSLLTTPEQRKYMYHQVRKFRAEKPIFLLDFWNDGEYVHGCIAGGRKYFHINANGDAEPCAFIHYSDRNINQSSLLEVLKSPLFQQYSQNQPFNDNHLRPCPLLDNPDKLRAMVQNTQASSTQMLDLEQVEALTDKCHEMAKAWAPVADEIWHTNKDTD